MEEYKENIQDKGDNVKLSSKPEEDDKSCSKVCSNIGEPVPQVSSTRGEFSDPVYKEIALANGHINRMNKDELQSKLAALKLDTRGVKDVMKRRLKNYYKKQKLSLMQSVTDGGPTDTYYDFICVVDFEATCEQDNPPDFTHEIIDESGLFPHKSTMPIELGMPLYLSNDDFCYRRTPKSLQSLRPCLKPCMRFKPSAPPMQTEAYLLNEKNGKSKRRVSFADHKGLALTKVKFFSHFDTIDIPLNITKLFSSSLTLPYEEDRLVLDFTQPSSDYLLFRQRLETELVCLEHCMLKEKALAGTVKVKNLSFEKSVKVRVTFDTWKSYTDLECQYLKDTYTGSDRDTFSFEISLPAELRSPKHIEFAICYKVDGQTYWDGNQGRNYRIIWSALKMDGQGSFSSNQQSRSFDLGIHFDLYGSSRCSHGMFPEWPSYAGYEDIRPYY